MDKYNGTREKMPGTHNADAEAYGLRYCSFIPQADVDYVIEALGPQAHNPLKLRVMLAANRYSNRICDRWGQGCTNGTREKVVACADCFLTFYCSEACQNRERCNLNKLDNGPLRITFIQV